MATLFYQRGDRVRLLRWDDDGIAYYHKEYHSQNNIGVVGHSYGSWCESMVDKLRKMQIGNVYEVIRQSMSEDAPNRVEVVFGSGSVLVSNSCVELVREFSERVRRAINLLLSDDVDAVAELPDGDTIDWRMAREIVKNETKAIEVETTRILSSA